MRSRRRAVAAGASALVLVTAVLAGCTVPLRESLSAPDPARLTGLQVLIPQGPGSGYDVTGRAVAKTLADLDLVTGAEVTNLPGASGVVGLARTVQEDDNGRFLLVMGLGLVGAAYTKASAVEITEPLPVARLMEESAGIFVPAESPYRTVDQLIAAWRKDPSAFPVGGASSVGGPDHLLPMLLAQAVGIPPRDVAYRASQVGGDLLPAVLGGEYAFAASGYGEFREQVASGQLRVLAVTGEKRIPGLDAPTLQESGIPLVFTNWRGVVAPPNVSSSDVDALIGVLRTMRGSQEWKRVLAANGWTDAFLTGSQFGAFIREQNRRVATVLEELGLA